LINEKHSEFLAIKNCLQIKQQHHLILQLCFDLTYYTASMLQLTHFKMDKEMTNPMRRWRFYP